MNDSDSLSDDNDQFLIKEEENDDSDEEEKVSNSSKTKSKRKLSSNNVPCKFLHSKLSLIILQSLVIQSINYNLVYLYLVLKNQFRQSTNTKEIS